MKHLLFIVLTYLVSVTALAQQASGSEGPAADVFGVEVSMKTLFAEMPDSIFPLVTKTNRLDCIDFFESDMPAQVKNLLDEPLELKALTRDYLRFTLSKVSQAEMRLLRRTQGQPVICLVKTYYGPEADSSIFFYDLQWKPLQNTFVRVPAVSDFFEGDLDEQARQVVRQLEDLPLVAMSLSPERDMLRFTLSLQELAKNDRARVEKHLREVEVLMEEAK